MKRSWSSLSWVATIVWLFAPAPAGAADHALLVGVTRYPSLGPRYQLRGPANDVILMRQLLRTRFGVEDDLIRELSERAGQEDAGALPTRAHIAQAFRDLVERVREGDQVVIFLAGHGSQQPARSEASLDEPDGLDEIFLPRDVGPWEDRIASVSNAISDNEIAEWIAALREQGCFVWLIVDACHSGTLLRAPDEQVRQVPAQGEGGLGVPRDVWRLAGESSREPRAGRDPRSQASFDFGTRGGVAALYACRPEEVTVECRLPRGSRAARSHGLLTFTLANILLESGHEAAAPLTYRELALQIQTKYAAMGRTFPTPLIEGGGRDREVLNRSQLKRTPIIRLIDRDHIDAGAVHGLTVGTILEVAPPVGEGEHCMGHVRIVGCGTIQCRVEPCAFEEMVVNEELPYGSRCRVVLWKPGEVGLRVRLEAEVPSAIWERLADSPLLRLEDEGGDADWYVRQDARGLRLIPAYQAVGEDSTQVPDPFVVPADSPETLPDKLLQIARGENLKRLAGHSAPLPHPDAVRCELAIELPGAPRQSLTGANARLRDGDRVELVLRNPTRQAVDLNLLYLDSEYGIHSLFPSDGEYNRLDSGDEVRLRATIRATTLGREYLVLIGTRSSGQPMDLSVLEQPGLQRAFRVPRRRDVRRGESRLSELISSAAMGSRGLRTRGITRDEAPSFHISLRSWTVVPSDRRRAPSPAARSSRPTLPEGR